MAEVRYIISDASKQLDVEPHVLRYWEEELELNIPRNELGHRYFRAEDLNILKSIKKLKEEGLQLKAIKMMLPGILEEDKLREEEDTPKQEMQEVSKVVPMEVSESGSSKVQQFQQFIQCVLEDTLKENNQILKEQLTKEVSSQVRFLLEEREEKEEKRYKKLDETIREMQKMRQETATTSNRRFFRSKKSKK
ncbi:MerR family transcriptional regulator [Vallitalea sp.]|jgi:DNA-binding transcriptional MerR regulator|uniref:MerR family transcriptional regulator n=1 Tax=Vallitalea sp. TaxID=1882829 RepID=UPI0025D22DF8|nr:MerR family transcriptional regulator [Vallitalea sp.]MCT4687625.1 MerR family transcriptional regulator [Vallitalea sp.]